MGAHRSARAPAWVGHCAPAQVLAVVVVVLDALGLWNRIDSHFLLAVRNFVLLSTLSGKNPFLPEARGSGIAG